MVAGADSVTRKRYSYARFAEKKTPFPVTSGC